MKNWNLGFWLPVLLVIGLAFTGCKKDDDGVGGLEGCLVTDFGDWEVTSFTQDGVEFVGSNASYNSIQIEFGAYDRADQRGIFTWTLIDNLGATITWRGNYEIIESTSEVEMTFTTPFSAFAIFIVECMGERLELNGNIDGYKWIIQARK